MIKGLKIGIFILLCAFVPLCLCDFVFADEEIDLGEIVVTATKTEKQIKESPQTVSVITKEDIEKLDNKNLGDVLREVSGIDIRSYGALGALNTITLRGSTERRISFLLDGIPVNDAQGGRFDLSKISLHNVEKIEILKGPASSLYGANALGGVVNIITKKAGKITEFKISSGKYNTRKYFGNYGGELKNLRYLISIERQTSDGERENSDYKGDSLNVKLDYLQNKNNYTLNYKKYKGEKGTPGPLTPPTWGPPVPYWPSKLSRQWDDNDYFSFMFRTKFSDRQDLTLKLYRNETYMKYFDEFNDVDWRNFIWVSKKSVHKNTTDGLELQNNIELNEKNLVIAGYELQSFKNDSTETGKHKLKNSAYYLQLENKNLKNSIINIGIRQDDNQNYGKKNSPRLSLVYNYDENTIYRIVFGKAFTAPTFNDLYWPKTAWAEGNPNLKPEDGESFEFATEYREDGLLVKMSIFKNDISNMIRWAQFPDGKWRPSNVESAEITGCEIELSNKITQNLFANFNWTLIDAIDKKTNKKLTYKPDVKFNYGVRYLNNGISLAFSGRYTDKRVYKYDRRTKAPKYLPSNIVYDAKISRDFNKLNLSVSVKNLFDKKYQEVYDYPMLQRQWNFEVGYKL